ncbi:MAG: hypothetical protein IPI05_06775 [Flavobacteriales bacterium]|nr:hypothetical protein [Flavobacteriales bacterium]
MSPMKEEPHEEFLSLVDINNYLLTHSEVKDYTESRKVKGVAGKRFFLSSTRRPKGLPKSSVSR